MQMDKSSKLSTYFRARTSEPEPGLNPTQSANSSHYPQVRPGRDQAFVGLFCNHYLICLIWWSNFRICFSKLEVYFTHNDI